MTNILDRVAKSRSGSFQPANPDEFLALRLARSLGTPEAAAQFALLMSQYGSEHMLAAYARTLKVARLTSDLPGIFRRELEDPKTRGWPGAKLGLTALAIERRCMAVAVFTGQHLEWALCRHLSSQPAKAEESAVAFVEEILSEYQRTESAALESVAISQVQRSVLREAVVRTLRGNGIALWEASKADVLSGFGQPEPKNRKDVRATVLRMWPQLPTGRGQMPAADAAALGLFVQTERLFKH